MEFINNKKLDLIFSSLFSIYYESPNSPAKDFINLKQYSLSSFYSLSQKAVCWSLDSFFLNF